MKMKKRKLMAGPFVGEFGYELFEWQARIRKLSRSFDHTTIITRRSSFDLYGDFADELIDYDPGSYDCTDFQCPSHHMELVPGQFPKADEWLIPINPAQVRGALKGVKPEFTMYGRHEPDLWELSGIDIAIHARMMKSNENFKKEKESRNWSVERWEELVQRLPGNLSIASIGISEQAMHIRGTQNKLDMPLISTMTILRNAKIIIGPSSGPIHLATLCGCPQLTWSRKGHSVNLKNRYHIAWNPFNAPVHLLEYHSWSPPAKRVFAALKQFITQNSSNKLLSIQQKML